MFDMSGLPDLEALAGLDEAGLVAAIGGFAQAEAVAAARRLAAIAELTGRRCHVDGPQSKWAADAFDAVAAQVGAACDISHRKACSQMYLGTALQVRLPKVGALFAAGQLNAALVAAIAWRTMLIEDDHALAAVDAALAGDALHYGPLSAVKAGQVIDAVIEASRPARAAPIDQRRVDALGVLAGGGQHLACACTNPDCPAEQGSPANSAVIHVVAHPETITAAPDAHRNGDGPPPAPITRRNLHAGPPEPDPPKNAPPALLLGGPLIPAPLLPELIAAGVTIKTVHHPGPDSAPEPRYRPSRALDEFVRLRDLTCRWPGCDKPAEFCDLDHGIAYGAGGWAHPSNIRCLCRKHHLIKAFHGWRDRQHPDGSIDWISPTGETYTTYPGSRLLFPTLCQPTGRLPNPTARQPDSPLRTLMMPTRSRTRTQNRAHAITTEHNLNKPAPP